MSNVSTVSRTREFVAIRLPIILYCIVGAALLVQGVRYFGAAQLMPYHLEMITTPWGGLDPGHQTLFLGLLKGFGAGSFCVGLAIILLTLIPLRAGSNWSRWAIPTVGATYSAGLTYVTNFALMPGATPIAVTTVLLGLIVAASVSSFIGESQAG